MIRLLTLAALAAWIYYALRDDARPAPLAQGDVLSLTPAGQSVYERLTPLAAHVYDARAWTDLVPLDVAQAIGRAQDESGIPALWMLYVIAHESGGNPLATGDGGAARGLAQTHRDWRDYHIAQLAQRARTRGAEQLDAATLAVWQDDPRAVPEADVAMLAEAIAAYMDKLGATAPAWAASATLDDHAAAMLRHQRLPAAIWRQLREGTFTAPAPADPWPQIRARAGLAELEV